MKKIKDLIRLNDELLDATSLEELEERLELGCWAVCGMAAYDTSYCTSPYDSYAQFGCYEA